MPTEVPADEPVVPLPKSRIGYAAAAAGFAAMAALVTYTVMGEDGTKDRVPEPDVPVVAVPASVPEPVVSAPTPEVVPAIEDSPTVIPKPKVPVRSVATTIPGPSSNGGGETPPVTTAPVVIPVASPEPERGSVHLVSGATSISLVGSDGAVHDPGRLAPGTYSIRATFPAKGDVANTGSLTVFAGQDLSVSCVEAMSLCKAR